MVCGGFWQGACPWACGQVSPPRSLTPARTTQRWGVWLSPGETVKDKFFRVVPQFQQAGVGVEHGVGRSMWRCEGQICEVPESRLGPIWL